MTTEPQAQPEKFAVGDTVYASDGRACIYVAAHGTQHIVDPCVEDEDGNIHPTERTIRLPRVFRSPPVEVYHAEIERTKKLVQETRDHLEQLRTEVLKESAARAALMAKLKRNGTLQYIDDFLEGKFKYVVEYSNWKLPSILTLEEALGSDEEERRQCEYKLLSLFGKSNGDLEWRKNQYYDGSGSWTTVTLHRTREEAVASLQAVYDADVETWRKGGPNPHNSNAVRWKDCPDLVIPQDILDFVRKTRQESLKAQREVKAAELAKLDQQLLNDLGNLSS